MNDTCATHHKNIMRSILGYSSQSVFFQKQKVAVMNFTLHSKMNFDFLFVADACFEFELRQVKSYLKINFIQHHFNFYNV